MRLHPDPTNARANRETCSMRTRHEISKRLVCGCKSECWINPRRRRHGDVMPGFIMRRCRLLDWTNAAGPTALLAGGTHCCLPGVAGGALHPTKAQWVMLG